LKEIINRIDDFPPTCLGWFASHLHIKRDINEQEVKFTPHTTIYDFAQIERIRRRIGRWSRDLLELTDG
jgi:hypothetical protein